MPRIISIIAVKWIIIYGIGYAIRQAAKKGDDTL